MLAIAGNPPLPLEQALSGFSTQCQKGCVKKGMTPGHTDGWGMSGFTSGRAVYFGRDPQSASASGSLYQEAVERAVKTAPNILIAHLRKASEGEVSIANTHPFHYQDWNFAHNGTVFGALGSFPLSSTQPLGTTDSERFFYWIYEQIHAEIDPTRALVELIKKSRPGLVFTSLTFVMSDGKRLWAYRDYGDKRLDKGETAADRAAYYTLYYAVLPNAVAIASEPIPGISNAWIPLEQRQLVVCTPKVPLPQIVKI